MTITFAMSIVVAVALAHTMTSSQLTMWQVVTVAKITASTVLESPRINPRIFYFCLKKHLTSAPGCGIIIVGRAGPGRRPGTEFPIGTPYGKILREKVALPYAPGFPGKPRLPRSVRTYGHTVAQKLVLICRVSKSKRLSICLSRVCNHARKFDF